jgi:hypothetical protein
MLQRMSERMMNKVACRVMERTLRRCGVDYLKSNVVAIYNLMSFHMINLMKTVPKSRQQFIMSLPLFPDVILPLPVLPLP